MIVTEFDEIVGFSYLRGLHINDSKEGLGSKRDRHEHIGLCVPPLSSFSPSAMYDIGIV
jgi:endonuclease IV